MRTLCPSSEPDTCVQTTSHHHVGLAKGVGSIHARKVRLPLERVRSNRARGHLPADAHDRYRIAERIQEACGRVAHARAGRHENDADPPRRARIALSCVDRGLLVPDEHVSQLRRPVERVVQGQYSPSGVAENGVHPELEQGLHDGARAVDGNRRRRFRWRCER